MNWFDFFIAIVFVYCAVRGYKSGLIKQLTALVGIIIAAILSGKVSDFIFPYLERVSRIPEYIKLPLSFTFAFVLIMLFFFMIGGMLETIVKSLKMGTLNKLYGSFFCFAKWAIGISIALNVLITMDDKQTLIKNDLPKRSLTFAYIQRLAPSIIPYLKFKKL